MIIPAYNAAECLPETLAALLRVWPAEDVVVVDDGSTDSTSGAAEAAGVECARHPANQGKGAALKTGFSYALDGGYDAVITLDADCQHDPSHIPAFLEAQRRSGADIVIGTRMLDHRGMPFGRVCSNTITSRFVSWRARCAISDSQSGYRLISSGVISSIPLATSRYETESELLIRAGRAGFRISEVPISVRYAGERSFIRPWGDVCRFISLIARSLLW